MTAAVQTPREQFQTAVRRLRDPAYTGRNRCYPCTGVNLVATGALALGVGVLSVPAGVAVAAGGLAAVYLRGYVVPGTPELTKRYLPELNGGHGGKPPDGTAPRFGFTNGSVGSQIEPTMTRELEPIEPNKAVDLYLAQKEEDASERTVQAHRYRLNKFLEWCDLEGITNLNELSGRSLYEYRLWRKEDGDLNTVSLRTQLCTLRTFMRFCESIDAVDPDLHDEILLPTLDTNEDARTEMLDPERAQEIREHLEQFEYASRKHLIFEVFWSTSARLGAVQSLDVEDFDAESQSLSFRHRPTGGTTLKNRDSGERIIALSDETTQVISDYIDHTRPDAVDDHGRRPLVATDNGRMSQSNIRALTYSMTRPCQYGGDCRCAEKHNYSYASRCEWSRSPHTLRRGSLTHLLKNDVPKQVVGDRADVSTEVLDKHYDQMTQEEKMEQRRDYLDNI